VSVLVEYPVLRIHDIGVDPDPERSSRVQRSQVGYSIAQKGAEYM
jgi:hypothetical protein